MACGPRPSRRFSVVVGSRAGKSRRSTTVANKFPVGEMKLGRRPDAAWRSEVLNPNGKRELILLVDDDLEVPERAGEMLTLEDYRVILARMDSRRCKFTAR